MEAPSSPRWIRVLRSLWKVTTMSYRSIALTLIIAGWLGELAIMLTRNLVKVEPGWTVELVTLALVYGSLLYIGLVSRHIGFTLVNNRLAKNKYLSRITPFISLVIVGILFAYSIQSVVVARQDGGTAIETPGFNYPNWLVVVVMPVVFFTLFLQLAYKFYRPNPKPSLNPIANPTTETDLTI